MLWVVLSAQSIIIPLNSKDDTHIIDTSSSLNFTYNLIFFHFSYNPELDRWCLVQPMHEKRLGVGVVVVNRLLYAIGGFDGNQRLASVECYHPENNEWSYLPSMSCPRSGAGVAAINQFIYIVGGFDGSKQLCLVERFDTENQIWEQLRPITTARSALSLTSLDGKLYAIGGFDGSNFLSIVEVYDPKTGTWEAGTPMSSGRSGHASAVIYQPSCVSNFAETLPKEHHSNNDDWKDKFFGPKNCHQGDYLQLPSSSSGGYMSNQANNSNNANNQAPTRTMQQHSLVPASSIVSDSEQQKIQRTLTFLDLPPPDNRRSSLPSPPRISMEAIERQNLERSVNERVLYVPQILHISSFSLNERLNSRLLKLLFLISEAIMERCIASNRYCNSIARQYTSK